MVTSPPPRPFSVLLLLCTPLSLLSLFAVLLAKDIIAIPLLTPTAHFLASLTRACILPITPFLGPLHIASIIHIWSHSPRSPSTAAKVTMIGMVGQYVPTALIAVRKVWASWKGELGLGEAWKGWVECTVLVGLCVVEWMQWKWDGGVLDGLIEKFMDKCEKGSCEVKSLESGDGRGEEKMGCGI